MSQNVTLKIKNILIPYLSTSGTFPYQHFVKYISAQTSTYDAYMNNILYCMLSLEKTDHSKFNLFINLKLLIIYD